MAAPPRQPPNMEQFEAYFQRADLDRDGRITGAEAVVFFQGSNLSKNILAQIWSYSDKNNTGFLGREEFYNALRLVTVAQSGRELTRDIVKAALEGPAASKIPAPQIKPVTTTNPVNAMSALRPKSNSMMPSSVMMGGRLQTSSQSLGFPGPQSQAFPNTGVNQPPFRPPEMTKPLPVTPAPAPVPAPLSMQSVSQGLPEESSMPGLLTPTSNVPAASTDWFAGPTGGSSSDGTAHIYNKGITAVAKQDGFGSAYSGLAPSSVPAPQAANNQSASFPPKAPLVSSQLTDKDSKAPAISGNGFSSDSIFGGDVFSASQVKQDASSFSFPSGKIPSTSSIGSVSSRAQPSVNSAQVSLPGSSVQAVGTSFQQAPLLIEQNQLGAVPSASMTISGVETGVSPSNSAQTQWPKMTQSDVQKYTKVFVEVDKDKDGKITGEQARNLFLSWRLPIDVLKKVWDLSDQDGDSMLSLREFCIALYLMERYREGRPLPDALPNNLRFDDTLLQPTSQHSVGYGGLSWQPSPGLQQQRMPGTWPAMHVAGLKPQQLAQMPSQIDKQLEPVQKKSTVPVLEKHLVSQLSNEEQNALDSKLKEATDADKKVQQLEKEIVDAKEKTEFYRTKMQELVLYKSRCDTRLNEVIERASADKHELEVLAKKYEEKYKQAGDVASKLTIEEATFRDIQERKMELYNAITKINGGGGTDDSVQARAEQVQSDLEELVKSLNDRCKQYGLRAKPTSLVELPFGWQPGVQECVADWDQDWDKLEEEEGFMLVKELTVDVENIIAPPKSKSLVISRDKNSKDEPSSAVTSEDNKKVDNPLSTDKQATESESSYVQNEDDVVKNPPNSPPGKGIMESPPSGLQSIQTGNRDASPRVKDNRSDHSGSQSNIFGDKFAVEHSWGPTFDTADDADSIWGFDPIDKETGHERNQNGFFGSNDFGLNPIKTGGSPGAASELGKERSTFFADSVPGTPFYNSIFSPRYNEGTERSSDGFSHFDSFGAHGNMTRFDSMRSTAASELGGFFSQSESKFTKFDSMGSTRDPDHNQGFSSFDDTDPFVTGAFKPSETPKHGSDNWSAF